MKIKILKNKKEAAHEAVSIIAEQIKKRPSSVLGLATGKTMIPVYNKLSERKISFRKIKTFNLDEYFLSDKLRRFMNRNFFNKTDIEERNIYFLDGNARNWKSECRNYEKLIKKDGGIDLQILGIGRNGHIGFNEPGSSFKSRSSKVQLSSATRKDNLGSEKFALTVGIGTILEARKILLIATGRRKAEIVRKFVEGRITTAVPASALKKHKDVTVLLDKDSASQLDKDL